MEPTTRNQSNAPYATWNNLPIKEQSILTPYQETAVEIYNRLRSAERILLAAHEHPDGDAIGSCLALLHALCLQGKQVVIYMPDPAPDVFSFVPGFEELTNTKPKVAEFDLVVLLDSTYASRTHLADEVKDHPNTICIDHHYDNQGEARINLIVAEAAATAHILTIFFEETGTPITKDMATCLLTGIFTDTGSFMHDSTTPEIMKLASSLMSKGARLSHIAHETYQKKDLPGLQVWGRALSRIMINQKTGAAVSVISAKDLEECGATLDDLSGVVNMLNTLPEAKFALLLCEYEPGKIKGSLRSEPHKGVDVSKIAKRLGGGGHKLAAGFEVAGRVVNRGGVWRIEAVAS